MFILRENRRGSNLVSIFRVSNERMVRGFVSWGLKMAGTFCVSGFFGRWSGSCESECQGFLLVTKMAGLREKLTGRLVEGFWGFCRDGESVL